MAHLKRYVMPTWPVPTKGKIYITRPSPGPHALQKSIPLLVLVRDVFKVADTGMEARQILQARKIVVDGVVRREPHFPVGLMDVITIPALKESHRVLLSKDRLVVEKIPAGEASHKLCKVTGKSVVRGGHFQIHLHDGRNLLTEDRSIAVGDTLDLSLPDQSLLSRYPRAEGATCLITGGANQGLSGTIEKVQSRKDLRGFSTATIRTPSGTVETRMEYLFITGGKSEKAAAREKKVKAKKTPAKKKSE